MIKQQGIISSCGHMTLKVKTRSRSTLPFVQLQPDVTDMTWRVFKMSKTKDIWTQTFDQMSQSQVLQIAQVPYNHDDTSLNFLFRVLHFLNLSCLRS